MKYVLDSSAALKWVLPEVDSGKAIRLRDEYSKGVHELHAPDIFSPEIANGLAAAERQTRIRGGEAAIFLNDILSAAPLLHHSGPRKTGATSRYGIVSLKSACSSGLPAFSARPVLAGGGAKPAGAMQSNVPPAPATGRGGAKTVSHPPSPRWHPRYRVLNHAPFRAWFKAW